MDVEEDTKMEDVFEVGNTGRVKMLHKLPKSIRFNLRAAIFFYSGGACHQKGVL